MSPYSDELIEENHSLMGIILFFWKDELIEDYKSVLKGRSLLFLVSNFEVLSEFICGQEVKRRGELITTTTRRNLQK